MGVLGGLETVSLDNIREILLRYKSIRKKYNQRLNHTQNEHYSTHITFVPSF